MNRHTGSGPQAHGLRRRHIVAATLSNALEFYDFGIYGLFALQIGHAFFPASSTYASLMLSLGTYGAGFITRPLGALVLGAYADRVGRKPAMVIGLTLIGLSMAALALTPSYVRIGIAAPLIAVLARLVQGFSLGGELGANTAYLAEASSPARRGESVSWQGATQYASVVLASLVGVLLNAALPAALADNWAWRIALLLGALAAPFGLWLRRGLQETLPQAADTSPRVSGQLMALGLVVLSVFAVQSYVFDYIVTYAQYSLHLSAQVGLWAELVSFSLGFPLCVLGGRLSDRFGRWPLNVGSNLALLIVVIPVYWWIVKAPSAVSLIAGTSLIIGVSAVGYGTFFASLIEVLPPNARSRNFGILYALSIMLFGGTTQLILTWLINATHDAMAPAWFLAAATAAGQIALMLFPETAPVRLKDEKGPWLAEPLKQST